MRELLMVAEGLGYSSPTDTKYDTVVHFYDIQSGELVSRVDVGQACGILHLKPPPHFGA